ncbi:MAG TPA: ATP-binding protein [Acidimicrobiales bacterium]|nr:ATP-binding protein [Acidimicrobiales bacterium]
MSPRRRTAARIEDLEQQLSALRARATELEETSRALADVASVLPVAVWVATPGRPPIDNGWLDRHVADPASRALLLHAAQTLMAKAEGGSAHSDMVELHGPPPAAYEFHAEPLTIPGAVTCWMADVSERHRLASIRRDFVLNVSHELRTPIGAIGLLIETLEQEDDPATAARLLQRMGTEAERARKLLEDMLDLSRLEAPSAEPVTRLDLRQVVAEAADRVSAAAAQASVRLELSLPDDPVPADGEESHLTTAVANLLDNAIKYSEPGSRVVAELVPGGTSAEIRVIDSGIGIPRHDLDRIFERFYRVSRDRGRRTGGTGLGLAIVRHVAERHGGRVTVTSREGEGSTFCLAIPMAGEPAQP